MKLEIDALIQVRTGLIEYQEMLAQLPDVLDQHAPVSEPWKGTAKNKYIEMLAPLRVEAENCSARLANSASVLTEALQAYVDTEREQQIKSLSLPSEDIF